MRNVKDLLLQRLSIFDLALLSISIIRFFEVVFVSVFNRSFYVDI